VVASVVDRIGPQATWQVAESLRSSRSGWGRSSCGIAGQDKVLKRVENVEKQVGVKKRPEKSVFAPDETGRLIAGVRPGGVGRRDGESPRGGSCRDSSACAVRRVMGELALLGRLPLVFLVLGGPASGQEDRPRPAAVKKLLVGTWGWANAQPSYELQIRFAADGDATLTTRVGDARSHHPAKYKVLDGSTLEITVDAGNGFTPHPVTRRCSVEVTPDRLTLRFQGTVLRLKRVR
jgi:hypothetical protein